MRRFSVALALSLSLVLAPSAAAADRTVTLSPESDTVAWEGTKASGIFVFFYGYAGQPCTKAPVKYCDETQINVTFPKDFGKDEGPRNASLTVGPIGNGVDDFDAYLYRINPDGSIGEQVTYSNREGHAWESVGFQIARDGVIDSDKWLLKVVYYAVDDASYTASASILGLGAEPPAPTPTPTPTAEPTATPTPTPEPTPEPTATPTPTPEPTATPTPAPEPAASPPTPTFARAETPQAPQVLRFWIVERRGRVTRARLRCPFACIATVRGRRAEKRLRVSAEDIREFLIRTPSRSLRAVVQPRSGGRPTILRAASISP
jgi:cell division septation protein DedD